MESVARHVAACVAVISASLGGMCYGQEDVNSPPAFPGAEGFGAVSIGGRGGRVIKVTNLNAKGPGSFQEACSAKGPRIVVFDVSGVIQGNLRIGGSNITIAGQTAPGAGITLAGTLGCRGGEDVIIRFLRVRPTRGGGDAVSIFGTDKVILDHVSASWGTDETLSPTACTNLTVQWCAIEESNIQWEGCTYFGLIHNYGMLVGYSAKPATLHHNLFAHHATRTPLVGVDLDYRNNVVYNVRGGVDWHPKSFNRRARGEPFHFNAVGNYFKAGPGAPHFRDGALVSKYSKVGVRCALPRITSRPAAMYADGNYFDYHGGYVDMKSKADKPWFTTAVATQTAEDAYERVLAHVGCLPRDAVGRRIAREVRTGTGSWGKLMPAGGLMEGLTPGEAPADTDKDGLPDAWEARHKLDPNDPADAGKIVPAGASAGDRHKGYTWIEFYINERADRLIAEAVAHTERETAGGEAYKPPPTPDVSKLTVPIARAARGSVPGLKMLKWNDVAGLVKILEGALARKSIAKQGGYAIRALGALGPEAVEAVPALLKLIGDLTEKRRALGLKMNLTNTRTVVKALAHIGRPALPELLAALEHKTPWVRACAAQALSIIAPRDEHISEALLKRVDDKDADVRADSLCALNRIGRKEAKHVDAYIKGMADENFRARRVSAEALGKAGPAAAKAAAALIKGLTDADEVNTRIASAWALGQIGPTAVKAAPALAAALGDSDRRVRWHAGRTLAAFGEGAADAVAMGLSHESATVRAGCARVLGRLGGGASPKTVARLCGLLDDESAEVRLTATSAIGKAADGSADARAALVKALRDRAWPVRWAAARSLGEPAVADADVAAALAKALKDDRKEVRDAAARALPKAPR